MRIRLTIGALTTSALLSLAVGVAATPANAASSPPTIDTSVGQIVGADGFTRTLSTEPSNTTGLTGVSSSVTLAPGDRLISSPDGQQAQLIDANTRINFDSKC
jgi:hypothetical protein